MMLAALVACNKPKEDEQKPEDKPSTTEATVTLVSDASVNVPVDGDIVKNKRYDTDVPVIFGIVKKDLAPPVLKHMARAFARKQARKGDKAYIFHLDRLMPPDGASFHTCDVWYALGSLGNCWRPFEPHDYEISDDMVDRFSAFAKTGSPNVGEEDWHPYHSKKDIKIWE